jgi:hypothetical protein
MTNAPGPLGLSDDELARLLALLAGADTVELKLTIPETGQRAAVQSLDLDALDAEIRQVLFFDTPELRLNQEGVIVRARRTNQGDDSVVKLRPVVPDELPAELRALEGFGVEVDAMPGGFVCSGRLRSKLPRGTVKPVMSGSVPLHKLFTKAQKTFYAEHAPDGIALDDLVTLGPITVLKLKFAPAGFARRMVVEVWFYPDGSRIFELSTKCATNEAFQVAAEARVFLASHGIDLGGEQQTKTKAALEFFATELRGA